MKPVTDHGIKTQSGCLLIAARKQIFASLNEVKKVFKIAPNTVMLLVFFEAKSDELINIYKGADEIEKPKAIEILSEINISNLSKYEKIRGS
jgi:20S proteasome alpha/beta subunit